MNLKTKFNIGDNVFIGKIQMVVNRIRINVGLVVLKFDRREVQIEYQLWDKEGDCYFWITEKSLRKSRVLKAKQPKKQNAKKL